MWRAESLGIVVEVTPRRVGKLVGQCGAAQDVGTNNTILSTQIGDARITYSGEGVLAESNKMGWLARFFNHPVWPF